MPLDIGTDMGVAKLKWRANGDSQEMISTIGFQKIGTGSAQDTAVEISNAWHLNWGDASLASVWTFGGCDVAIGAPGGAEVGEYNVALQGSGNWSPLPTNCALLVTKITAQAGKGGRGRMFLPAGYLDEDMIDQNGFLSGPTLAGAGVKMNGFFEFAGSGTSDNVGAWLLFHNTEAANVGGSLADPITSLSVQAQIATQRQRMRR